MAVSFIGWKTGVPRENHWPAVSHWQTLSHNVVSSTPRLSGFELTTLVVMCTDSIGSYKSNYHTITTAPIFNNIYCYPPAIAVGDIEIATVRLSAVTIFSSPGSKVHVNYFHHLASVVCCLSSVNFSHFKLFLRNHWANWNQT